MSGAGSASSTGSCRLPGGRRDAIKEENNTMRLSKLVSKLLPDVRYEQFLETLINLKKLRKRIPTFR